MTIEEIIKKTEEISKANQVKHLYLFGSYADGTPLMSSDIDFFVKGSKDTAKLREELDRIPTLTKIDVIDYDCCHNKALIEDMDKYGKQIF